MSCTPHNETIHPAGAQSVRASRRKKSKGQSLVELAFVAPLLILMMVVAGDLGRAFTAYLTIGSAAGAGAHYGMIEGNADDTAMIEQVALSDAGTIWGSDPVVTVNNDPANVDATYGFRWIEVTVTYSFEPIISAWPIPSPLVMSRTVRMPVLGGSS